MKGNWLKWAALASLMVGATSTPALVRADTPFTSGTVISGASNGIGNRISVNGSTGSTVIQGSRWGIGNSIKVENGGSSVVIDDEGVTVDGVTVSKPSTSCWSKKVWSDECGAYLYWSPKAKGWYRFHSVDRAYYPVEVYPEE